MLQQQYSMLHGLPLQEIINNKQNKILLKKYIEANKLYEPIKIGLLKLINS